MDQEPLFPPVPPPIDTPGKPQEPIPSPPKDSALFKTANEIKQLYAIGQSKETLAAMLLLCEKEKEVSIDRVNKLEVKLDSESRERESSQKLCAILSERLGSPATLMSGILTLSSTVLLAVMQPFPKDSKTLIMFGVAIALGAASVLFSTLSYFKKPQVK